MAEKAKSHPYNYVKITLGDFGLEGGVEKRVPNMTSSGGRLAEFGIKEWCLGRRKNMKHVKKVANSVTTTDH